jgi:Fe-coproporphyrin III synthase
MVVKIASQAVKSLASGTKFRTKKALGIATAPTFLVYQLTNNCNSRCQMCSIWKKKSENELTAKDIQKLVKTRLFSKIRWMNLTGGEPFTRTDIVGIVKSLTKLPQLEGIAIPTNGYLTEKILRETEEILKILPMTTYLSITCSIDGFEKTHEAMRGVPGAFNRVNATLDGLLEMKKRHKNFNVGVQPTITKLNINEIEKFYNEMRKKVNVGYAVMLTSKGYYGNTASKIALTDRDKEKVAGILSRAMKNDPQYAFYYENLINMFKTQKRDFGCLAGHLTVYMDPHGNLSPCPILSGNSRYSFGMAGEDVWFEEKGDGIRKNLKSEPICKHCSLMCDLINVAKVDFFEFAGFMFLHPRTTARLAGKLKDIGAFI